MDELSLALEAIRKKLVGKALTYKEIYAVMDEISHNRLGEVLTTYFAASGYSKGFTNEELFFLTKAMVETGEKLSWGKDIVADKHSIGGVPGTRTTLIVVPIVAAAGFTIPKSSSRAITTPDGTADDMEVLSRVEFSREEIERIVNKTNGCVVWGGSFHIAPADDIMIQVEKPLLFESFDKIIVSIMAKKIAFGSNHVVIDLPYGKSVKVHSLADANILKDKFEYIAKRFGIEVAVLIRKTDEPAGRGVGPVLETREAIRVLEQHMDRPIDLEDRAIELAGALLDLCTSHKGNVVKNPFKNGKAWALHLLQSKEALKKIEEIIEAQGGNPSVTSETLSEKLGSKTCKVTAHKNGIVHAIDSHNTTVIGKLLGAPKQKGAGIYFHKKVGEKVKKGEAIYTLYSESMYNLTEAKDSLEHFPLLSIS